MLDVILAWIGKVVVYGGGSAAIAYALFMWLGKKWIEQKFSERLELLRRQHGEELEQLRHNISVLFSRVTKIHEKEFEVLSFSWEKLNKALGLVHGLVKHVKQYPDFSIMSPQALEAFLKDADLEDYQKDELKASGNKHDYYEDVSYKRELYRAREAIREFHNYIIINRIFLKKEPRDIFSEIDRLLSDVSAKYDMARELRLFKEMHGVFQEIGDSLDKKIDELEKLIQKRLRFEEA